MGVSDTGGECGAWIPPVSNCLPGRGLTGVQQTSEDGGEERGTELGQTLVETSGPGLSSDTRDARLQPVQMSPVMPCRDVHTIHVRLAC